MKRRRYSPQAATLNGVQVAIRAVQRLSAEDQAMMQSRSSGALADLQRGATLADEAASAVCLQAWRSLADVGNMAETFAGMGLGSGPDADELIQAGQEALQSIFHRRVASGDWILTEDEHEALAWLVRLHCGVQLTAASYGEFERAFIRTRNRVAQALAGNAPRGAMVVSGDIGQNREAVH